MKIFTIALIAFLGITTVEAKMTPQNPTEEFVKRTSFGPMYSSEELITIYRDILYKNPRLWSSFWQDLENFKLNNGVETEGTRLLRELRKRCSQHDFTRITDKLKDIVFTHPAPCPPVVSKNPYRF